MNEGSHFEVAATLVGAQLDGYYRTKVCTMIDFQKASVDANKESHLLRVVLPYHNLGGKEEIALLSKNHGLITAFLRWVHAFHHGSVNLLHPSSKFPNARFILQIQTHASPTDGGLLYSTNGSIMLDQVSAIKR